MDMFVVAGGSRLVGRVAVGGSKNASLPMMAASLMTDDAMLLEGVPDLVDVRTLWQLLESLGVAVERLSLGDDSPATAASPLRLAVFDDRPVAADYELVRRMRAGFCVLGPLLARRGAACVSLPGGCNIGARPIDLHLRGLAALGADIRVERGYVVAKAKRLRGANVFLGGPFGSTVTGTCNLMCAAALAAGVTVIEAAACEPEVVDLGDCLNAMGAKIEGLGTPVLRIAGVDSLGGVRHTVIPDRIEAATLMIAAAITGGDVTLTNVRAGHLTAVLHKLGEIGVACEPGQPEGGSERSQAQPEQPDLRVSAGGLRAVDVTALPYPGVPTDVQAQLMALLSLAEGISVVTDKVFPDRFMHASELARMGAQIRREGQSAFVCGVPGLTGACVMASDLRASAALVVAALAAQGSSVVRRIYHLDRGYERLEDKLNALGANVRRARDEPANVPAELAPQDAPPAGGERPLTGPRWLARECRSANDASDGSTGATGLGTT